MPTTLLKPDPWTEEAARLPIAFAQVREDPAIDAAVLADSPAGARVLMIASGGDTAAWLLAATAPNSLHLVDVNPAQFALTRLKLHLLAHFAPPERESLLGHRPMAAAARAFHLHKITAGLDIPFETLGPPEVIATLGPDQAGRYERLFARLREELAPHQDALVALLRCASPDDQASQIAAGTELGEALDAAFAKTMRLENLVRLFGEDATRHARVSFAEHFTERTRHVLSTSPARENPFLWQMLLGRFPENHSYLWLRTRTPPASPDITYSCAPIAEVLHRAVPASFDFIHLSNVLDWLSPATAAETLDRAWKALRPGGHLLIRQLNSTLDIPEAAPRFTWQPERAAALHAGDQSFFYRALFLGRKGEVK